MRSRITIVISVALALAVLTAGAFAACPATGGDSGAKKAKLHGTAVAVLVAQDFEDSELASPVQALREAGAEVVLVAEDAGVEYTGKNGEVTVTSDVAAADVTPAQFDGLVIPGGHAPAELRTDPHMTGLARKMVLAGKPVAAICHGPQVLITARVLEDRKATCYSAVAEELKGAGARYRDRAVVKDGNIITSRNPDDLPQFNAAIIRALSK
jgi:protease I